MAHARILPRLTGTTRPTILYRHPTAERHRVTPCRSCAQPFTTRHPDPVAAHAGTEYPLAPRNRPRRHCYTERRREAADGRRSVTGVTGAGAIRRTGLAMESNVG